MNQGTFYNETKQAPMIHGIASASCLRTDDLILGSYTFEEGAI